MNENWNFKKPGSNEEIIDVPHTWNAFDGQDGGNDYFRGECIYRKAFEAPEIDFNNEEVYIQFAGVNASAKVFINNTEVGHHNGGYSTFRINISRHIKKENLLEVRVDNGVNDYVYPQMADFTFYGGIYRDVELLRLPETFIKNYFISLVPNSGYKKIRVALEIDGPKNNGKAKLEIPKLNLFREIECINGKADVIINAEPELWSPEKPRLYDVKISYLSDEIQDRIGFREIKADKTGIYLNGKKIFLKGVCAHEESVPNGKAVTDDEILENFKLAKEMNCNFMRLAHYPHTDKAARIADKIGILLWEEIPVYWAIDFSNPETYENAENQLTELILRDRNRASVIVWSVGNENPDTDERLHFMSSLAKKAKELDPTRLVSAACLVDHSKLMIKDRLVDYIDVIGINEYYGWYAPDFNELIKVFNNSNPQKPVVITEFGADALRGARGTVDDLGTEDCQENIFRMQTETLGKIPYIHGTSPWILYDFRCPRRTSSLQLEYNRKGLLSEDKTYKKPAYFVMKEFYASIKD